MAYKSSSLAGFRRKLTKREIFLLAAVLSGALSWFLYQFPLAMLERSNASTKAQIAAAQKNILEFTSQIADLQARKSASGGVSPGWQLADQKSAVLFLQDMTGEARRIGVNLVSVHPTREIEKEKYKEVSMNLDLKGRYRELAEYFKRIENLPKVVNVRKVRLESCPDSASVCAAKVEAVTYMAK